ncbi:hypothetical protein KPL71_017459 [Citrus sinensis]|uniref:Uncharacterized protein n=1 Tax=Citrus sinensis TaxID=2711 RepID=A0ACB8JQ77_CITSI|nr:hypothetical protein KPL71_017459 [Citrus sinensis]
MASTSSSTPSNPVTLSSTLSLPKSCTSHTANKIENLVEYSYIPESAQISESSYPLLSPYHLYKRPSSFTRSIRTLISTRRPHPKEYIQSSRLDQCSLQATPAEQYVTLEIPSELISNWKREGYTHLHLGGIRLILTLHGRKGLPVTARLAMLDTRFKQYQDAVIGTVLTTLHAGSVLLTFYPNFNLSLQDPNLPTTLKVQIQIQGAEQISSAKIATLHHQLVYRLQNHALDLPTPEHHSDTLMVLAESDQIPTIIQIPRQIPRHELIKLMPLEWISNYEQFHNNTAPIQTSESMFERRQDGTVRMTFKPPPSAPQEPPRLSFTYSSMITAVQTAQEDLPITGFNSEGYPVYPAKHNGHFLWDAPGSGMCDPNCPCWDDWEEDDDYATTREKKPKKKKPSVPCHLCDPKPPSDPPPPPAPLLVPTQSKERQFVLCLPLKLVYLMIKIVKRLLQPKLHNFISLDRKVLSVIGGNSNGEGSLEPVDGMAMSNLVISVNSASKFEVESDSFTNVDLESEDSIGEVKCSKGTECASILLTGLARMFILSFLEEDLKLEECLLWLVVYEVL